MRIFILSLMLVLSCGKDSSKKHSSHSNTPVEVTPAPVVRDPMKEVELITPHGDEIATSLAYTSADKKKGLQFVQPEDFSDNQGMFFVYFSTATRRFWMLNTYFALDIIYLNADLVIKKIAWEVPSYSGSNILLVPRAPAVSSRYVLEMKAGSPLSAALKVGDKLQWRSSLSMEETLSRMKSSAE